MLLSYYQKKTYYQKKYKIVALFSFYSYSCVAFFYIAEVCNKFYMISKTIFEQY